MAVAPWHQEHLSSHTDPVLKTLRGDFFCAPFGGNAERWRGIKLPAHGETATRRWTSPELRATEAGVEFRARMRTKLVRGLVTKRILLKNGETNVYSQHVLEGFTGPLCVGHHAMLSFPKEQGSGFVSMSPWREGRVCPKPFELLKDGGFCALKTGARFRSLHQVPLAAGGMANLSKYPAREGFEDLVMVSSRRGLPFAWTAVCFPKAGYIWFGLKDPRTLASTVLWHSNGGRRYPPWNGRHRRVLGLEEVTAYFHFGQSESAAPNPLSRRGVATVLNLKANKPVAVNYVLGVVSIPAQFNRVCAIEPASGGILLRAASGAEVYHPVSLNFLESHTNETL